ncbi:hypothetical protein D3C81_1115170 [compost metagenome]
MLVLEYFLVFLPVIFAEFFIAVFDRVGSFNQVIAKESVAGFDAFGVFTFKSAGLVSAPREACVLGNGSLVAEAVNVTDLG